MSASTSTPISPSSGKPPEKDEFSVTVQRVPSGNFRSGRIMSILPTAFQHTQQTVTCYDYLGRPKTHGTEQRYLSPTTGACRELTVQAVHPTGPREHRIRDHMSNANKLGLWLAYTSPFRNGMFWTWIGVWVLLAAKLVWSIVWVLFAAIFLLQEGIIFSGDFLGDSEVFNTGHYKFYSRPVRGQLWEARSRKEFSSRSRKAVKGEAIPLHALHPSVLMLYDSTQGRWVACGDEDTIIRTKYIAISCRVDDMYDPNSGPKQDKEKEEFKEDVRAAAARQNFNAYWSDLECVSNNKEEKKKDLYRMADVYRNAEKTLIMLKESEDKGEEKEAWKSWGDRVWTFPEALLSRDLCYMFRGRTEIGSVSLHQLANLAYPNHGKEQAIINAYSGKDPLERLERLTLLKEAIFRRNLTGPGEKPDAPAPPPSSSDAKSDAKYLSGPGKKPDAPAPPPSSDPKSNAKESSKQGGFHGADRVYALMGFFEHRIEPDYEEKEMHALARLSMANDSDRIAERMVSLLPPSSGTKDEASWYADGDVYKANLWDILPEVQVAGITEGGALVLDGCKSASIRWKDFPEVAVARTNSIRRTIIGSLPFLAWPAIISGIVARTTAPTPSTFLIVCGIILLLLAPRFFVFSEEGRVIYAQPWLIGVKGVMDADRAALCMFPAGNKGPHCNVIYTPSGSPFAIPDEGRERAGSQAQYDLALRAEKGAYAGRMYTLIDTCSATIYYFSADKPPTVCLFTGREGGMGRFVLCSEKCDTNELHKETVLRMPTEVSQRMYLSGWVAVK